MMNIRSLSNPAQVPALDRLEGSKAIKSDQTGDREPNGQQPRDEADDFRPLTEAEVQTVLEKIKKHEGVLQHGLLVELQMESQRPIVMIKAPDGQTLRRFVERDLFSMLFKSSPEEVQLLKRTA